MADRKSIYEQVTNQIIEQLENGVAPLAKAVGEFRRWNARQHCQPKGISWGERAAALGNVSPVAKSRWQCTEGPKGNANRLLAGDQRNHHR
jgi:hypothetical protein